MRAARVAPVLLFACWVTDAEVAARLGGGSPPGDTDVPETDVPETDSPVDTEVAPSTCVDEALAAVTGPRVGSGTLTGADDETPPCGPLTSGPDRVWSWVAPAAGCYQVDTAGSAVDTVLSVWTGCDGQVLACNDDADDRLTTSRVLLSVAAAEEVIVVVDAAAEGLSGAAWLAIQPMPGLVPEVDAGTAVGTDVAQGSNVGADTTLFPDVPGDCPFPTESDVLVRWVAPATGIWRVNLRADFDAALAVYHACEDEVLQCADVTVEGTESVVFEAYGGQPLVLRVAGYAPTFDAVEVGDWHLDVVRQ